MMLDTIPTNDFKDTEIGPIPVDWRVVTFEQLATLQRGKDLPKKDRCPVAWNS
jgi:hypothetical protein